ncbi:sulfatase modifying factor 1 (C-alpha-formyglycine- generating enzyme 1) [Nocardioides sp. Root614]|nr:sulfatase modifying factor 1 (C-alpha-formyglycine- generating enzyme 1) [Nocardioides sp. Root614]KRA92596.1 sulfatase modifying factor 1 (C-alpha-formyglycine- generating enzyme 1) [Nocardioides sp. Root682]
MDHGCCSPQRMPGEGDQSLAALTSLAVPSVSGATHAISQVTVPGGTYWMGDAHGDGRPGDGETPVHAVELDSFEIDATSVTNADWAVFVDATGHVTEAEVFGTSGVFHLLLSADPEDVVSRAPRTPWWLGVRGADWRHPGGRHGSIDGLDDHPVVHVSWNDAQAYCQWAGRRLPTEAEWEVASRGGIERARYPWGDDLPARDGEGDWPCNIWQGSFPGVNTEDDGWLATSPVRTYQPNGYGVWQSVGNIWEWCADWFDPGYYARAPLRDPRGPGAGSARVLRGGSYLCHDSYCNRYRNAARSANTPDSSVGNAGFRTVALPVA